MAADHPQTHSQESDEALLDKFISKSNRPALEELIKRYEAFAYRLSLYIHKHPETAEEAAQEAFLQLMQKGPTFRNSGNGSFKRWFAMLVVNATRMKIRSEKRTARRAKQGQYREQQELIQWEHTKTKPSTSEMKETKAALNNALTSLRDELRIPITLFYLEGMAQADVASLVGISTRQIQKRIRKGLELLRKPLTDRGVSIALPGLVALLESATPLQAPSSLSLALNSLSAKGNLTQAAAPEVSTTSKMASFTNIIIFLMATGIVAIGVSTWAPENSTNKSIKTSDPTLLHQEVIIPSTARPISFDFNDPKKHQMFLKTELFTHQPKLGRGHSGAIQAVTEDSTIALKGLRKHLPLLLTFYSHPEPNAASKIIYPLVHYDHKNNITITNLLSRKAYLNIGVATNGWCRHRVMFTKDAGIRWIGDQIGIVLFYEQNNDSNDYLTILVPKGSIIEDLSLETINPRELPDLSIYRRAVKAVPKNMRHGALNVTEFRPGKHAENIQIIFNSGDEKE